MTYTQSVLPALTNSLTAWLGDPDNELDDLPEPTVQTFILPPLNLHYQTPVVDKISLWMAEKWHDLWNALRGATTLSTALSAAEAYLNAHGGTDEILGGAGGPGGLN